MSLKYDFGVCAPNGAILQLVNFFGLEITMRTSVGVGISFLVILLAILVGMVYHGHWVPLLVASLVLLSLLVLPIVAIEFGWIKWLVVKKTRGVAFLRLGEYVYACIMDKTRHFDDRGFIMPGPGPQHTGFSPFIVKIFGLVLYINGLVEPAEYGDFNESDDGFGDKKNKNLVVLHQERKEIVLEEVETKSGTAVGLTIAVRLMPADLERFLTESPTSVVKQTIASITQLLIELLKGLTIEEIHALKASGSDGLYRKVCEIPGGQVEIDRLRNEWGVGIPCDALAITDIRYADADQEAQAESRRQKWAAKGVATELVGAMLEIEAQRLGAVDGDAARIKLASDNPARLDQIVASANETLLERKLAESGGHRTVKVKGLRGGSGSVEQLIATAVTLLQGLAQQNPTSTKPDKPGRIKPRGQADKDKDILSQDPTTFTDEQYKEYEAALQRRQKRKKGGRTDEEDE